MKRGQVTIFIIIAVLIIAGVGIYFAVKTDLFLTQDSDVVEIKKFISQCLKETSVDAIYFVSSQGGYYKIPGFYYEDSSIKVPIYYDSGNKNVPGLGLIEDEFENYVIENIDDCIDDFKLFRENGFDFEKGEVSVRVNILGDEVVFNLDYPVRITKGDIDERLNSFREKIGLDFTEKYKLVKKVADNYERDPSYIPFSYLTLLSYENDFTYSISHANEDIVVFSLVFNEPVLEEPLIYSFAIKYNWENLDEV
ncbi:hypothetical protein ACFL0X_00185 [Nanoarchaeota archaeon]